MKEVIRKNGFIDLNELGKEASFKNIPWRNNATSVEEYGYSNVKYIFYYKNEIWIFKSLKTPYACYAELVAEELAKYFKIPCAFYDLAYSHKFGRGVITKSFKVKNACYVNGFDIISNYLKIGLGITDGLEFEQSVEKYNSLEGIWNALEWRYLNRENKEQIVKKLMDELVDVFIYDMMTGQTDRHEYNWGIVETENDIFLQPLFDNERLLFFDSDFRFLPHTNSEQNIFLNFEKCLENIIIEFISVSENIYVDRIKEWLSLIAEENIHKVFLRVEEKIKNEVPEEIKKEIFYRFQKVENAIKKAIEKYEPSKMK